MGGLIKLSLVWELLWAAILLLAQMDPRDPLVLVLAALLATVGTCLLAPRTSQSTGRRSGRLRIT
jgi:hypothetical protein